MLRSFGIIGLIIATVAAAIVLAITRSDSPSPETAFAQRRYQPVRQTNHIAPAPVDVHEELPPPQLHAGGFAPEEPTYTPYPLPPELQGVDLHKQTAEDAFAKSHGCIQCHQGVEDMHQKDTVHLGCCDCHGGDPAATTMEAAHVHPRFPQAWVTSANPIRSYTLLNHEDPAFIRFVNPGDLRVAHISCGQCHGKEVLAVKKSMMTHGCMLWGSALYNNGAVPYKWAGYGESYAMNGAPQRLQTVPPPTSLHTQCKGIVPFLDPLPRYEITQPGNVLRIFERGGRFRPEIGLPEKLEEPGRPRERLSLRGLGTENRTDPVFISLQKTRLLDPTLNFLGTNDHPGDYRSSGCTACHVVYANDRSPTHSGPYAKYGHMGLSASVDPTIPKDEPGHPIAHKFTLSIPTSQCIVCHIHPGTNVLNSYLGFMWWDNETDGELMYPREELRLSAEEVFRRQQSNPNDAALRGLWGDPDFLANVSELNPALRHTQFADFHGHGWVFRAVYKKDRKGNLLDYRGNVLPHLTAAELKVAGTLRVPSHESGSDSVAQEAAQTGFTEYVSNTTKNGTRSVPTSVGPEPFPHAEQVSTAQLMAAMLPSSPQERQCGRKREGVPVHLMDIHLEKGMHCTDCHFNQDNHGNTLLYGEVRAAIEITCTDCHGTINESIPEKLALGHQMRTTGPASPPGGHNLMTLRTPFGKPRFELRGGKLYQHSTVEPDLSWEVTQTADTINPQSEHYNPKSHIAKTVRWEDDGYMHWGGRPPESECAHQNKAMSCTACHTSWNPSCFGCHLPQKANVKAPQLHNLGDVTRNRVSYNFQTLRDDVFMLARDGNVTGNRINPARSSCAIHVTSYNQNREAIYTQQQTISAGGMSGIAFSTNVPHTVRGGSDLEDHPGHFHAGTSETKMCTDCHVSKDNDNNAIMAQLLMHGTNYTNFIGRYCWVAAGEHGLEAVVVTEQEEPQAVIGSSLHKLAYPHEYEKHVRRGRHLMHSHEHPGKDIIENVTRPFDQPEILSIQARGEFLYCACGPAGVRVFDIAFIEHKGFSERILTAPVSPVGQRLYVRTEHAMAVAAPTTIAPDPTRVQHPENCEQPVHPLYGYIYVADKVEGLILIGAATLLNGDPTDNFLEREVTFNPNGLLNGARAVTIVGAYAYVCCDAGLVVISLHDPTKPVVTSVVGGEFLHCPKAVQAQFRYAFVCDEDGVKVLDITHLDSPRPVTEVELEEANSIYLARTYAYVAAGEEGLVILDITNPAAPFIDQVYNAEGEIKDVHDVKLGITNVSEFAYLADGEHGLRVVQLTSAETPGNDGFSPRPTPKLIATYKLPRGGEALAISEGLDRDRAVDESGNQIAVFGRVGARPLNYQEQRRLYLRYGQVYHVSDNPFDLDLYRMSQELYYNPKWNRTLPQQ